MENLIYKLVKDTAKKNASSLITSTYNVISNEEKKYYLLNPKKKQASRLMIESVYYTVSDYHISIYENLRESDQNAEFHITVEFEKERNKTNEKIVARAFFDRNGSFLFLNIKDKLENVLLVEDFGIKDFCFTGILPFVEITKTIYKNKIEEFENLYQSNLKNLYEQSKEIETVDSIDEKIESYDSYQHKLEETIKQIDIGVYFEIFESKTRLNYFKVHLEGMKNKQHELDVEKKLFQEKPLIKKEKNTLIAQESRFETKTIKVMNESTKIAEIKNHIKKAQSLRKIKPSEAIKTEYLYQKSLLDFNINNNEFLETITNVRKLEEEAKKTLITIFIVGKEYEKIKKEDLYNLISVAKFNSDTLSIFTFALANNRVSALKIFLEEVKNIDLNMKIKIKNDYTYPLIFAYQKEFSEVFELLLNNGANPEFKNTKGETLLIRSCIDNRNQEMVSLLNAKANPFVICHSGFAAISNLIMMDKGEPNIKAAKLFLKHTSNYAPEVINQVQGILSYESTPLSYACQKGWTKCVELLLSYNADPNKIRTDGYSPLAICVGKDNEELFNKILNNSKIEINYGLCSALAIAEEKGKTEFLKTINNYIKDKQLKDIDASLRFPAGELSMFQMDCLLNRTTEERNNDIVKMKALTRLMNGNNFFNSGNNTLTYEESQKEPNTSAFCKK